MVSLLNIGAVLLGLAALMLIAQYIAWLMTDARYSPCTGARPLINFKPFNCRACLTFWLTLLLFAIVVSGAPHKVTEQSAINALVFAFINFFYIKTKIQVYE